MAAAQQNNKRVDLLDEDKPISGQKFACLSFVSPEKIIAQKNEFFFGEFVKGYDFLKKTQAFEKFLSFIAYKYSIDQNTLIDDFKGFVKEERDTLVNQSTINDDYKTFLDHREEELQNAFSKAHNFQTSVRGLKVRGSFNTQEEAELRCKMLREEDPNHDIYVAPVGMWVPWDPDAYKTGRVEYMQEDLNNLMKEKLNSEREAKAAFDQRVKDARRAAIEENIAKAKETGNKLTQTINKDGELVSLTTVPSNPLNTNEVVSAADIKRELFEGDNIRTDNGNKPNPGVGGGAASS